jgi:hypothetical protein
MMSYLEEKTYRDLLGALGETPKVWAECLFVDPVGDIAVLGSPDDQELWDQAEAYDALTARGALSIGRATIDSHVQMLSLNGGWVPALVKHSESNLWLDMDREGIQPGMSGSPIINVEGVAVGVVTNQVECTGHPPLRQIATALPCRLPVWLLRQMGLIGRSV